LTTAGALPLVAELAVDASLESTLDPKLDSSLILPEID
jgi:hypothetical protein